MIKLPPFRVWPQVALVWDPSFRKAEVINQMGFFSISLGPLALEIDGRPYVRWMTDVILPEARMMESWPESNEPDGYSIVKWNPESFVHPDSCPCNEG